MTLWGPWRRWRRRRILRRNPWPQTLFDDAFGRLPLLAQVAPARRRPLQELAILFLHHKVLEPVAGLRLQPPIAVDLALQACLPVLTLGLEWYDGWRGVVLYPDEFVPEEEYVDAAGVVHRQRTVKSGEAWPSGPVVLSLADVAASGYQDGYNVVIHELAHKLDMLNGDADGAPPLHRGMDPGRWQAAFSAAFAALEGQAAGAAEPPLDPYALTSPAEFFAVASEAFFELPTHLEASYPAVFGQLLAFYRLDPRRGFCDASPYQGISLPS